MREFSDDQLVAIAKAAGDHAAFNELFGRHHSRLRLFLLKRVDDGVVDDVMQETYLKAYMNLSGFRGGSAFATWLFSIASNEYRQQYRKKGVFERLRERLVGQSEEPALEAQLDVFLDFEKLAPRLNDRQRDAFILHAVYGCSHGEVAERLQMPLGSVKSYLSQAESILREKQP